MRPPVADGDSDLVTNCPLDPRRHGGDSPSSPGRSNLAPGIERSDATHAIADPQDPDEPVSDVGLPHAADGVGRADERFVGFRMVPGRMASHSRPGT